MGFSYDESGLPLMATTQSSNGHDHAGALDWPIGNTADPVDTDDEIGDILLRVQKFASESTLEAQHTADSIVESAQIESHRLAEEGCQRGVRDAQTIVESARAQADQILEQARRDADQVAQAIVERARQQSTQAAGEDHRQPAVSSDAVANLTASIAEFADTNRELIEELVRLRNAVSEPLVPRQPWDELQVSGPSAS